MTKGSVVNNGHYQITLEEDARYSDDGMRWTAKGRRWVPSRRAWEDKAHVYGGCTCRECAE